MLTSKRPSILSLIVCALAIIAAIVAGLIWLPEPSRKPEILMGLVIVLTVSTMILLLFIIAAAFAALKLTDPRQALGLPDGSIRALIALLLIMIWISLSIYLFNQIADSSTPNNEERDRLAQHIITTMGTLVVAVAGFYFGTSSVKEARATLRDAAALSAPSIRSIIPRKSPGNQNINATILGKNFRAPLSVLFVKADGTQETEARITSPSDTKISCTFNLSSPGVYDLIVINKDGSEDQLEDAFTIT